MHVENPRRDSPLPSCCVSVYPLMASTVVSWEKESNARPVPVTTSRGNTQEGRGVADSKFLDTFVAPQLKGMEAFVTKLDDGDGLIVLVFPYSDGNAGKMRLLAEALELAPFDFAGEATSPTYATVGEIDEAKSELWINAGPGFPLDFLNVRIPTQDADLALERGELLLLIGLDGFPGRVMSKRGNAYLARTSRLYRGVIACTTA